MVQSWSLSPSCLPGNNTHPNDVGQPCTPVGHKLAQGRSEWLQGLRFLKSFGALAAHNRQRYADAVISCITASICSKGLYGAISQKVQHDIRSNVSFLDVGAFFVEGGREFPPRQLLSHPSSPPMLLYHIRGGHSSRSSVQGVDR